MDFSYDCVCVWDFQPLNGKNPQQNEGIFKKLKTPQQNERISAEILDLLGEWDFKNVYLWGWGGGDGGGVLPTVENPDYENFMCPIRMLRVWREGMLH